MSAPDIGLVNGAQGWKELILSLVYFVTWFWSSNSRHCNAFQLVLSLFNVPDIVESGFHMMFHLN